jgi:hypothetical protein
LCKADGRSSAFPDPKKIKPIFEAYHNGRMNDVPARLEDLDSHEDRDWMKMALAYLALRDRRADLLTSLVNYDRATNSDGFQHEADCVDETTDPEVFKILEESDFRKKHPRQRPIHVRILVPEYEYDLTREESDDSADENDPFYVARSHPLW